MTTTLAANTILAAELPHRPADPLHPATQPTRAKNPGGAADDEALHERAEPLCVKIK